MFIDGQTILVCSQNCMTKFEKAIIKDNLHKKLKKIPLKPKIFRYEISIKTIVK